MKIVTLTLNPTIDSNTNVKQVVPDHKLRCTRPHHEPGGGGLNVSRAIKKLGGESLALVTAGGVNGEWLKTVLDENGIYHSTVALSGLTRENLTVFEETSDNQYRFVMPGPKVSLEECEIFLKKLGEINPTPEYIVASGSLPPGAPVDFYGRVAELGRELGSKVIVDTSGEPLRQAVKAGVFMVKPNMRELEHLVGCKIKGETQMKMHAEKMLRDRKSEVVVISLGAGGAFMVSKNESLHLRAPTVPIQSKVGAGDSMVAGMVLSLGRGRSLLESVKFGIAAGAAAVMTPGTELCRRKDTERLYKQMSAETD